MSLVHRTTGQFSTLNKQQQINTFQDNTTTIVNTDPTEYVNIVKQTFYQIMTQQPYTFNLDYRYTSSSNITIIWNYDSIIATDKTSKNVCNLAYLNDNKLNQLPYIDYIQIDISGTYNNINTNWIDCSNISIPYNVSYNQNQYKQFILSKYTGDILDNCLNYITSSFQTFDLRIYGNNFSQNYPTIENRSLIITGLSFVDPNSPSQPIYYNMDSDIGTLLFTYYVIFTENNIYTSNALLKNYIIDFSQNQTLSCYSLYPLNNQDMSSIGQLNNISVNQNFTISLNNLRAGTKYYYTFAVSNNLNQYGYSPYSNYNISNYTLLPVSGDYTDAITNNPYSTTNIIIDNNNYITTSSSTTNLFNYSCIYINLALSNSQLTYNNNNPQFIEITNSNHSNQINENYGYGQYVYNLTNLVSIQVYINNIIKQSILYDGFINLNQSARTVYFNNNNFNYISIPQNSLYDMYQGDINNQGIRLVGGFSLNNINVTDISNNIGQPSSYPYSINFNYNRITNVNHNNTNNNIYYNIYIDYLSYTPTINAITTSNINNLLYCMGIPSVAGFDLSMSRTYNYINSQFMYVVGNGIIATINNINNTSCSSTSSLSLNTNMINSTGTYSFTNNQLNTIFNNYYTNIYYTSSILTLNNYIDWSENVYNLYNNNSYSYNLINNHYCDYLSFNTSNNGQIISCLIDLSLINLYELSNISLLGSGIGSFHNIIKHYTNHSTIMQDYSLLFINGLFQSNGNNNLNIANLYPATNDFNYNNIINNYYIKGSISYDLNGNISNNGYKFIAFRIYKSTSNTNNYVFNNNTYSRINYGSMNYLSFTSMFSSIISTNIINSIFDSTDNTAIGFCTASFTSNNYIRIGNFKQTYNPIGGDWTTNGSINTSYYNTLTYSYGAAILNSNGDYGIYVNPFSTNDDLTIYIGIQNI